MALLLILTADVYIVLLVLNLEVAEAVDNSFLMRCWLREPRLLATHLDNIWLGVGCE